MTTNELTGRELDAACARAMGHKILNGHIERPTGGYHGIPKFSTDAATLPEKMAWLRRNGSIDIEIGRHEDDVVATWHDNYGGKVVCRGSTIDEAVARLVVAVAEAEAGAK